MRGPRADSRIRTGRGAREDPVARLRPKGHEGSIQPMRVLASFVETL